MSDCRHDKREDENTIYRTFFTAARDYQPVHTASGHAGSGINNIHNARCAACTCSHSAGGASHDTGSTATGLSTNRLIKGRGSVKPKDDTETAVLITRTADAEVPDFRSIFHMRTNTCADIIIADTNQAQSFAHIGREFFQTDVGRHIIAGHIFHADGQTTLYLLIHTPLDFLNLKWRRANGKLIIQFTLLAFNMRIA